MGKRAWRLSVFAALGLLVGAACGGVRYPNCEKDEHCNTEGHVGLCVAGICVACRSAADCKGRGETCTDGACAPIPNFCDDKTPCGPGKNCEKNRCAEVVAREPVGCEDDKSCAAGEKCQNGRCVAPPPGGPGCRDFPAPKFDFESPELRGASKDMLSTLAKCLLSGSLQGRRVILTGHCDNRGEYEFNMGLGAERAEAVKLFLVGLGVPNERVTTSSRGKLDAMGTDESGWENDRRVDVEVR